MAKTIVGGWPGSPGDPPAASFHPWRLPEGLVQDLLLIGHRLPTRLGRRSCVCPTISGGVTLRLHALAVVLHVGLVGHGLPTRLKRRSCVCPTGLHLSGGVTLRLHAVPRSHRERVGHREEQTLTGESCSIAPAPACSARATPDDCDAACVAGSSAGSTPSSSSPLPHRACRSRAAACAPRRCDCTSARFAACSAAATSR